MQMLARIILTAGVLVAIAGCGSSASVSGDVQYDGKPIPDGMIRFFPRKGTPGKGASAEIVRGAYSVPIEEDLQGGAYVVDISALRETKRLEVSPDTIPAQFGGTGTPAKAKEFVQYIPEKYNRATTLETQLQSGDNRRDFKLER